jgi:hypothetical protein
LGLSFPTYSQALAAVIRETSPGGAFVVGITGTWGSGKTTLMEAVLSTLGEEDFIPVRFNAWAHSKQEGVWRGLFVSIVTALEREVDLRWPLNAGGKRASEGERLAQELDEAERALYGAFVREVPGDVTLDAGQLARSGVKLALRFVPWGDVGAGVAAWVLDRAPGFGGDRSEQNTGGIEEKDVEELLKVFKREVVRREVRHIQSMEQFRSSIDRVAGHVLGSGKRLVVAVDDVDRCLPEQGLEVFEAIKLYLDLPGSVFLVAMDQDVLQHALDLRYRQNTSGTRHISAEVYAEKMIDLSFAVPLYDRTVFAEFVKGVPGGNLLWRHYDLIGSVLPRNPRTWQRLASRMVLYQRVLDAIQRERNGPEWWALEGFEERFVKLQLLNFRWPRAVRALGSMEALLALERCASQAEPQTVRFGEKAATSSAEVALRELAADAGALPEGVWGQLDDLALLRFLAVNPFLATGGQVQDALERVFSLELPRGALAVGGQGV